MNGMHARRANHLLRAAVAIAIGAILAIGCVPAAAFADDSDAAAVRTAQAGTASAVVEVALNEPDGVPEGGYYNKYNFYSGLDWCGHFAVWCIRQAGVPTDVVPDMYNCGAMVSYYQSRGEYHDARSYTPKPGDLIFYTRSWGYSHVGIVVAVDDTYVYTREGNTNFVNGVGQVASLTRRLDTFDTGGWGIIDGYASPAYAAESVAPGDDDSGSNDSGSNASELETYLYSDVAPDAWYVEDGSLDYVSDLGIMGSPVSDASTAFRPEDDVTRAEAVTILYRIATGASEATTDNNVETPFEDVWSGHFAAAAAVWAYDNGVATGYATETGRVLEADEPVTREQLAAMVARTASVMGVTVEPDLTSAFADVQGADELNDWGLEPMAWCIENGIIGGNTSYSPAAILPQDTASRCEMAKIATVFDRDVL